MTAFSMESILNFEFFNFQMYLESSPSFSYFLWLNDLL